MRCAEAAIEFSVGVARAALAPKSWRARGPIVFPAKAFADLFTEDGHFWDVSAGINYYGKETGKVVEIYAKAFPDMHRELYSMWTVGDMVFVELSLNGTQKGPLGFPIGDLPATHKKMSTPCLDIFKIKNGKVVSFHCYTAATQLLGQLGVLGNLAGSLQPR